jgi:DNA-binding GntR family transcriptional regulator
MDKKPLALGRVKLFFIQNDQSLKTGHFGGRHEMKTNTVFKRAHNQWLARLDAYAIGSDIGSEPSWAEALGVSRTTVRSVLAAIAARGILSHDGRRKVLLRRPARTDLYPDPETEQVGAIVEKRFMKWILDGDCKPGQQINGLELARQFGVSTSAIRDYLKRFSQYGLLERRPSGSWAFKGFTSEFAEELFEVREMFELRSAQRFVALAADDPAWGALERIKHEHLVLIDEAERRFADFSELDERFHRLINDASRNRFIVSFYDLISMIFHYHYQWNKRDEKQRNIAAMREHLIYIEGLQSRDRARATESCRAHMTTARATLMASIGQLGRRA